MKALVGSKVEAECRRNSAARTHPATVFARATYRSLPALVALALVSCATIDATTTEYVGVEHFPPSNPTAVEILRTAPTRPHDRLGEIVVDASTEPAPPVAEVEQKLRVEAASIGANAAVVVYDRVQPMGYYVTGGWWDQTVEPIEGRKLVGVAIRYRP